MRKTFCSWPALFWVRLLLIPIHNRPCNWYTTSFIHVLICSIGLLHVEPLQAIVIFTWFKLFHYSHCCQYQYYPPPQFSSLNHGRITWIPRTVYLCDRSSFPLFVFDATILGYQLQKEYRCIFVWTLKWAYLLGYPIMDPFLEDPWSDTYFKRKVYPLSDIHLLVIWTLYYCQTPDLDFSISPNYSFDKLKTRPPPKLCSTDRINP